MNREPENQTGTFLCPRTLWGALPSAFVCATIAFIAYLTLGPATKMAPRRLWLPVLVQTNGSHESLGETRQMEFWTPSAKTKDYLTNGEGKVADRDKWQIIPGDDLLEQFGAVLHSNKDVFGYHRVEAWGHGTTKYKPGWWWTMTVYTNYSVTNLAAAYRDYWKSSQAVFVEVIDNRGSDDK